MLRLSTCSNRSFSDETVSVCVYLEPEVSVVTMVGNGPSDSVDVMPECSSYVSVDTTDALHQPTLLAHVIYLIPSSAVFLLALPLSFFEPWLRVKYLITQRRSVVKSVECFQRCLFVCEHDNFWSKHRMMKLVGRCVVQKSQSSLNVCRSPLGAHPQKSDIRLQHWENQRRLSNFEIIFQLFQCFVSHVTTTGTASEIISKLFQQH